MFQGKQADGTRRDWRKDVFLLLCGLLVGVLFFTAVAPAAWAQGPPQSTEQPIGPPPPPPPLPPIQGQGPSGDEPAPGERPPPGMLTPGIKWQVNPGEAFRVERPGGGFFQLDLSALGYGAGVVPPNTQIFLLVQQTSAGPKIYLGRQYPGGTLDWFEVPTNLLQIISMGRASGRAAPIRVAIAKRPGTSDAAVLEIYTLNGWLAGTGNEIKKLPALIAQTFGYNDKDLAVAGGDPNRFFIATFDETKNEWVPLKTTVDPVARTVTAESDHLSWFAFAVLLEEVPAPETLPATGDAQSGGIPLVALGLGLLALGGGLAWCDAKRKRAI
jgi:LPXTG-motif cell wall-anchored protein